VPHVLIVLTLQAEYRLRGTGGEGGVVLFQLLPT